MRYKMVCIDMDGTLLGKKRRVSKESKDIIKRAYDKGVEIVVTTGRIYNDAAYYSHFLGVQSPVIAANGAIIREKYTDEVIYENSISQEVCLELVNILKRRNMHFHFYTTDSIYCSNYLNKLAAELFMTKEVGYDNFKINYHIIKSIDEWKKIFKNNNKITKCIAFSLKSKKMVKFKEDLDGLDSIVYFGSGSHSVEINNRGVSKGKAVKVLATHYGFNKDEIICIGDNENDISMIEYAGLGVAMGNAIEEVKDVADYITDTNLEDGVMKAIKKFILEKKENNI